MRQVHGPIGVMEGAYILRREGIRLRSAEMNPDSNGGFGMTQWKLLMAALNASLYLNRLRDSEQQQAVANAEAAIGKWWSDRAKDRT